MTTAHDEGIDLRRAATRGLWHGLAIAALLVSLLYQAANQTTAPGIPGSGFSVAEAPAPLAPSGIAGR
jgi:hypothetical protein